MPTISLENTLTNKLQTVDKEKLPLAEDIHSNLFIIMHSINSYKQDNQHWDLAVLTPI